MMGNSVTEQDWKLFRKKIVEWQKEYIERLNQEYIEILTTNENEVDKFWTLEKRIQADKRKVGVQIDMRRSMMIENLLSLLVEGVITVEDLELFSAELKGIVNRFIG